MARDSNSPLQRRIVIDGVLAPLTQKNTAISFQVTHEINALHRSSNDLDGLARDPLPLLRPSQFAVGFEQQRNGIA